MVKNRVSESLRGNWSLFGMRQANKGREKVPTQSENWRDAAKAGGLKGARNENTILSYLGGISLNQGRSNGGESVSGEKRNYRKRRGEKED